MVCDRICVWSTQICVWSIQICLDVCVRDLDIVFFEGCWCCLKELANMKVLLLFCVFLFYFFLLCEGV